MKPSKRAPSRAGSNARTNAAGAGPIAASTPSSARPKRSTRPYARHAVSSPTTSGAIGRPLCQALDRGIPGVALAAATARDRAKGEAFLKSLGRPAPFLDLAGVIAASDLVVEASTQAHLEEIAPKTLAAGKDLIVL